VSDVATASHDAVRSGFQSVGLSTLLKPLWRQRKVQGAVGPLGILMALTVTWAGGTAIVMLVLNYLLKVDTIGSAIAGRVLAFSLLSIGSVLILSCIVTALPAFFLSKDLEMLAAAPIAPSTFFAARFLQVVAEGGAIALLLVVPLLAGYGLSFGGGILWPVVALLAWVPLWLTATSLGCIAVYVLVAVVPPTRAQFVFRLIGLALCVGAIYVLHRVEPQHLTQLGTRAITEVVKLLDVPLSPWLPTEWAARVLKHWLDGFWDPAPLAWLWLLATVALAGAYGSFRALYARGIAAVRSAGRADHPPSILTRPFHWLLAPLATARRELLLKEMRLLGRDAALWSQFVLLIPLVLVYVVGVSVLPTGGGAMPQLVASILPVVNVGLAGMVLAAVTSRLVLPSIAAEGTMWWLLRAAPVRVRDIIFAKYWAATGPLALVAVGIVGLTSLLLGTAPIIMALSMLTVAALMFAQAALALYIGSINPRFDAETAVNQTVTWQGILFLLSAGLLTMLVALSLAPAMYWYARTIAYDEVMDWWRFLRGAGVGLILCGGLTVLWLRKAESRVTALDG
jgi:ABC-2 type transport system permease protein